MGQTLKSPQQPASTSALPTKSLCPLSKDPPEDSRKGPKSLSTWKAIGGQVKDSHNRLHRSGSEINKNVSAPPVKKKGAAPIPLLNVSFRYSGQAQDGHTRTPWLGPPGLRRKDLKPSIGIGSSKPPFLEVVMDQRQAANRLRKRNDNKLADDLESKELIADLVDRESEAQAKTMFDDTADAAETESKISSRSRSAKK